MKKIRTIIRKEWAEVFKNRMVVFTVVFLPLLFAAIPLILLLLTRGSGMEGLDTALPAQLNQLCGPGLTGGECFQVYMAGQFMLLFLLEPLIIPVNIAAYSIVGEKTTRSLEPLLATPITTAELLGGKNLAAVIPAVLATWAGFLVYCVGLLLIASPVVVKALLTPIWLVAILIVGPLFAVLSVNFCLMISSRVNDPRAAEQISTIVILPVMILFIGQIAGFFVVSPLMIILLAMGTFVLDLLLVYFAVQLFQRETILTRWK